METYFFVYETTNLQNGKKYRGVHKTKNLNDGYLGSGTAFTNALNKYGRGNFSREVLEFCSTYEELLEKEKFYVDEEWVSSDDTYNLKTGGQSAGILSEESKNKISETLKRRYRSGEIIPVPGKHPPLTEEQKKIISENLKNWWKTHEHPAKGKDPWNKGTKGAQVAWNKGKEIGPMSSEEAERRSRTLIERYKHQEHHSKGGEPWNKGTVGAQEAWNKGKKMEQVECPHCGKMSDPSNAKRWHFDNCKYKDGPVDVPQKPPTMERVECPYCGKVLGINVAMRWHFEKCKHRPQEDVASNI